MQATVLANVIAVNSTSSQSLRRAQSTRNPKSEIRHPKSFFLLFPQRFKRLAPQYPEAGQPSSRISDQRRKRHCQQVRQRLEAEVAFEKAFQQQAGKSRSQNTSDEPGHRAQNQKFDRENP